MQVSVETIGDLGRRLTIQIPAARIEQEVDTRLRSLVRTAKVDGFRPGKVPFKVLQLKYEGRVREEVVSAVIESSYKDALTQQNLRPAGDPKIEPTQLQPGKDLSYTALIEVYPEINVSSLDSIVVNKPEAEVTEQDIDAMLDVLRRQRATWSEVSRPAKDGDRATINYFATLVGASEPFMTEQQATILVGSKGNGLGFEDRLLGLKPGDSTSVDFTYPQSHPNTALREKSVRFHVEMLALAESRIPDMDDEFIRGFGIAEGGIAALRAEVAANMSREMNLVIKSKVKDQVLEGLLSANPIKIPSALVEDETDRLIRNAAQEGRGIKDISRDQFRDRAARRVSLGLLIAEIVKINRIMGDPARVRSTIELIASSYEEPEQVVKWYYGDRELLSGIEALVLEDQVVDWLLERAKVSEIQSNFQALMNPTQ